MPFKDREKKRAKDRARYHRLKAGCERPPNPLTMDEWRALQRYAGRTKGWAWNLLNKVAAVWGVPPFH
jgi:hypothetical protein